jgi:hypothetical protein
VASPPTRSERVDVRRHVPQLSWVYAVGVAAIGLPGFRAAVGEVLDGAILSGIGAFLWQLVPVTFVFLGAFIVTRRPDNLTGWLLLAPGLAVDLTGVTGLAEAPIDPGVDVLVALWFSNVSWVLVIFPIMLLLALFPTGRPVSPRWRWHTWTVIGMGLSFFVLVALVRELGPVEAPVAGERWTVTNPIGLIPDSALHSTGFRVLWSTGLVIITLGAIAAMVVRYQRAARAERQQLKWLLYAMGVFGGTYIAAAMAEGWPQASWLGLLFSVSVLFVPVSVTIAILRHRVFDIDIIIRRTVSYAVVTASLAAVYVGSVVAFQSAAQALTGAESSLGVAASTLLIAALFNPLRQRIRSLLGRRFFRETYELERTLVGFASHARTETDADRLLNELMTVVDASLHPGAISLLLLTDDDQLPHVGDERAHSGPR